MEVNIDFDSASTAWRANKKKLDNCMFSYKCFHRSEKTGKYCTKKPYVRGYCRFHSKMYSDGM